MTLYGYKLYYGKNKRTDAAAEEIIRKGNCDYCCSLCPLSLKEEEIYYTTIDEIDDDGEEVTYDDENCSECLIDIHSVTKIRAARDYLNRQNIKQEELEV